MRYIEWSRQTKARYGTITNYICEVRLQWKASRAEKTGPVFDCRNPIPFVDEEDYKILPNDWPYGLDEGIVHMVVWLKNKVPAEPPLGHMTAEGCAMVQEFVQRKFIDRVRDLPGPEEKVLWFKNWSALQSVPGLEHVHVLVRDVPEDIILEWTKGERPIQTQ